jgi:hypothetical protein
MEYSLIIGIADAEKEKNNEEFKLPIVSSKLHRIVSENQKEVYYFAIVDILQKYDTNKKIQQSLKSLTSEQSLVMDPKEYSKRFQTFLNTIIN